MKNILLKRAGDVSHGLSRKTKLITSKKKRAQNSPRLKRDAEKKGKTTQEVEKKKGRRVASKWTGTWNFLAKLKGPGL